MSSLTGNHNYDDRRPPPPPSRPNKLSSNIFTAAASSDNGRLKTTVEYEAVTKTTGSHHNRRHHVPPHRQYLVSFREGATKPSELFGSLKRAGRMLLGESNSNSSSGHVANGSHSNDNNSVLSGARQHSHEEGKTKCQCRHHLKKLREQNKLDEQRYTRAILSANNLFNKGDPDSVKYESVIRIHRCLYCWPDLLKPLVLTPRFIPAFISCPASLKF